MNPGRNRPGETSRAAARSPLRGDPTRPADPGTPAAPVGPHHDPLGKPQIDGNPAKVHHGHHGDQKPIGIAQQAHSGLVDPSRTAVIV